MSMGRPLRRGVADATASPEAKPAAKLEPRPSQSGVRTGAEPAGPWNAAVEEGRKLDLAEYPSALLLRVANVIHQDSTAVYARKHGLSVPEWRILGRLYESAPLRLTALCQVSHFDKAQATRVLRGLTARRLVRTYADATHKHRLIVDITPAGRKLALAVFPEALAEQVRMLRALTPEERRVTFNVLRKLLAVFGSEIPAPADTYKEHTSCE
jgi:DNA-binding MarR family transcriptional regulator